MKEVAVHTLELGDIIRLQEVEAFNDCTVYKLEANGDRHVIRPYVHTSEVSYSGPSVIPYMGWEDFQLVGSTQVVLVRSYGPTR